MGGRTKRLGLLHLLYSTDCFIGHIYSTRIFTDSSSAFMVSKKIARCK